MATEPNALNAEWFHSIFVSIVIVIGSLMFFLAILVVTWKMLQSRSVTFLLEHFTCAIEIVHQFEHQSIQHNNWIEIDCSYIITTIKFQVLKWFERQPITATSKQEGIEESCSLVHLGHQCAVFTSLVAEHWPWFRCLHRLLHFGFTQRAHSRAWTTFTTHDCDSTKLLSPLQMARRSINNWYYYNIHDSSKLKLHRILCGTHNVWVVINVLEICSSRHDWQSDIHNRSWNLYADKIVILILHWSLCVRDNETKRQAIPRKWRKVASPLRSVCKCNEFKIIEICAMHTHTRQRSI